MLLSHIHNHNLFKQREREMYTQQPGIAIAILHSIYRCLTDRTIRKVQKHTDSHLGSWATYPSAAVIGFFSLLVAQKTNTIGE
jgi:hypothetical protein